MRVSSWPNMVNKSVSRVHLQQAGKKFQQQQNQDKLVNVHRTTGPHQLCKQFPLWLADDHIKTNQPSGYCSTAVFNF